MQVAQMIPIVSTPNEKISVMVLPNFTNENFRNCLIEHYGKMIMEAKTEKQKQLAIESYNVYSPTEYKVKKAFLPKKANTLINNFQYN